MNLVPHDKGLRDKGLRSGPPQERAKIGGGEGLELALVVLADIAGRHRLSLPAADLHDHLERHAPLLQPLRGVPARAVLDEVVDAGLREVPAEQLVAFRPAEIREAGAILREEERLMVGEL